MEESVMVGQVVPNFSLEVYDPAKTMFSTFSLEKTRNMGKWTVLIFYPGDYTFVCPTELADVGRRNQELEETGVVVVSVSRDSKFVHLAWHREEKLLKEVSYLMGSDPTGQVSRLFGALDESTGLALRGTFIINPEGKLVGSEINFYNLGRNAEELVRKMKANTYLAKHPEEACPANWSSGQKTLKPGEALVGRVADALAH